MHAQSPLDMLRAEFRELDLDTKSEALIEYADKWHPVPQEIAARPYPEAAKVPACESEAYLFTRPLNDDDTDGGIELWFAVENPQGISAKALAVILQESLRGAPLSELSALDEELIYDFFGRSISMGRGQGLMAMVQMLRARARHRLQK